MPIGITNIHKQINVSEFINISVSFAFCELNRVARWNKGKIIMLLRSSFQIPKYKHWFHIKGQTMSM